MSGEKKEESKMLSIRMHPSLYREIKKVAEQEYYNSISDCARSAIRIGLKELSKEA